MKKVSLITKWILVSLILFGSIVFYQCNDSPEKIKVTINSWVGFGPLFIAQEAGIFEKHGLSIEIVRMENAPDRRASLLSNRVQVVASCLDDLAVTLSQGIDAVAFCGADYSNGGDAVIAKKGIVLEDIHNYSTAVQPGFVHHFFLLYVLHKNGISIDNLKISPMTANDAGAAFLAGNIDVAVTWQPYISQAENNGCEILASTADYPEAILDLFIAKKDWLKNNPNFVSSFRKSWDEAVEYISKNKEKSLKILSKNLGFEPAEVEEMLLDIVYLTSKNTEELVIPKLDRLSEDVVYIWKKAGYISKEIDLRNSIKLD